MKPHNDVIWFSVRKNKRRTTFNVAWGYSPELEGWDLMMWQRTCQEFCVDDRLTNMFHTRHKDLPGDFELSTTATAAEAGECLHCPGDMVEDVMNVILEAKDCFKRRYFVGAHND